MSERGTDLEKMESVPIFRSGRNASERGTDLEKMESVPIFRSHFLLCSGG